MKKSVKKWVSIGAVLSLACLFLTACAGKKSGGSSAKSSSKHTVALITDISGVNDHSFNESGWRGMKAFGKAFNLPRGNNGYQYFESSSQSDYVPNITQAANAKFQTIFGVGYALKDAISQSAKKYPKQNFVIIDDLIKGQKNVASVNFKSNDASFLAGVAAAETTKTDKVGFIGGTHSDIVDLFDAGFTQGVQYEAKKLGKKITVMKGYIGDFTSADKGKSIAQTMYAKDADVIFHAAGPAGLGAFQEARSIDQTRTQANKVWTIGVDSNQQSFGHYKDKNGKKSNFCLSSVMTGVNVAVKDISTRAYHDKFPSGKNLTYGLKGDGVYITRGFIANKTWTKVQQARSQIIAGKITVAKHPKA